jgi:uncharacterized protein (TIGR02265 family)
MPAPKSFRVSPTSTLTQSFVLEERLTDATSMDTLKGMFFERILDLGKTSGIGTESIPSRLLRSYRTFGDYPVGDYYAIIHEVSVRMHPRVSNVEAMRRVSVRDFERLAESTVGRVMLSFAGDVRSTLMQAERLYGAILKGSAKVRGESITGGVRLTYRDFPGLAEFYPIGTIEGLCRTYKTDYEITVDVLSPRDADYTIRLR